MKIINAHVHAIEIQGMLKEYPDVKIPAGISAYSEIEKSIPLLNPKTLLKQMDEAEIQTSVLYALYAPIVYASNEYVASLCKKHPDRFMGFASVDPKKENARDILKKGIEELGLKGIKLHPALQDFDPSSERYFWIYEEAQKWGIPVVFHIGSTTFGSLAKLSLANPLLIDDIAVRFPTLRILLTHLGTLWEDEAFMVVEKNPYVFIDTAAYLYEIPKLLTEDLISRVGEDKFIFGTDYPQPSPPHPVHQMKDFVDVIRGLSISQDRKEKILCKNFERLLSSPKDEIYKKPLTLKGVITNLFKF